MFEESIIIMVGSLVALVNALVEAGITPIFDKYNLDKFWIMYISWVLAAVLVFLAGLNIFDGIIASQLVGQILTAIIGGRGANILHDLVDRD